MGVGTRMRWPVMSLLVWRPSIGLDSDSASPQGELAESRVLPLSYSSSKGAGLGNLCGWFAAPTDPTFPPALMMWKLPLEVCRVGGSQRWGVEGPGALRCCGWRSSW